MDELPSACCAVLSCRRNVLQDKVLLDHVLHTLDQDKRSKARAINHVNRVTEQTPLSMVRLLGSWVACRHAYVAASCCCWVGHMRGMPDH